MVIKTNKNKASVLITRKGACGGEGCSKCSGCEHKTQVIVCSNYVNAKVGDSVEISGDDKSMVKYTALLYLVPLSFFLVSLISSYALLENRFGNYEFISFCFGLLGLLIGYLIVKIIDKKFVDSDLVHITKINGGLYE
ncbi:SoxR reducing system RseC family protein [uncultured Finegoldia sp.]|uniref:SoxR reducing system RseC family protein n=1 Tax=uncultured Finegoldia sp. TaxID=328009 RepID=UPI002608D8F5|nr:SoxR reducing system RseC family protein [uncultured Finegoldia sp.]